MATDGGLINLGELSKPATVLIEKVCNAVGVLYEPTRARRMARAEADSERIRALARIELSQLEERALQRLVHQEARKQENIESITAQAARALPPEAKASQLDEDWIAHFFKQCDTVTDKEMQGLWSKLLAGEATVPGTYSKRTVDFVSTIDKRDAALFTQLGQFVWMLGEPMPVIFEVDGDIYKRSGISFAALKHLDAIGLISFESVAGYQATAPEKRIRLHYFGTPTVLEFPTDGPHSIQVGKALLTTIGKELIAICGAQRNQEFYDYVLTHWREQSIIVNGTGKVSEP
jgi:hypothetical protein